MVTKQWNEWPAVWRLFISCFWVAPCTVAQEGKLPPGYLQRPLAASGQTDAFAYQQSETHPGLYEVRLQAQDDTPVFISGETLQLVLSSPVPEGVRASLISQYPYRMMDMYQHVLNTHYPDDREQYIGNPLPAWEGAGVRIIQDPYAPNYARVRVQNADGTVEEFSLSRKSVDEIFSVDISDDDLSKALAEFPYRLPENARYAFNHLSRDELIAMIEEVPGVARQEFVKIKRVYMNPASPTNENPAQVEPIFIEGNQPDHSEVIIPPLAPPLTPVGLAAPERPPAVPEAPLPLDETIDESKSSSWIWISTVVILLLAVGAGFMVRSRKGRET